MLSHAFKTAVSLITIPYALSLFNTLGDDDVLICLLNKELSFPDTLGILAENPSQLQ